MIFWWLTISLENPFTFSRRHLLHFQKSHTNVLERSTAEESGAVQFVFRLLFLLVLPLVSCVFSSLPPSKPNDDSFALRCL